MDEMYGVWYVLRNPSVKFLCDFSRQVYRLHHSH